MKKNNRAFGDYAEKDAKDYLKKNGYTIIEENFRIGRHGEVDIIAIDGQVLCFIEVKARTSYFYGTPSEAVNAKKMQKITKIAAMYIQNKRLYNKQIRFDVIEMLYDSNKINVLKINLIKNAF